MTVKFINYYTCIFFSACCLITTTSSYADNLNKYFEDNDSIIFDENKIFSNNRADDTPIVTIKRFDSSALKDLPQYGIVKADLDKIIKEDQKTHKNRYTIDRLSQLATKLTDHYRKKGLILAKVYLPPQNIKRQAVKFEIILGKIASITAHSNDDYSEERIIRPFRDILNKPVYIPTLESSLIEVNNYPGLSVDTQFRESEKLGYTQIHIKVKEEKKTDFTFGFDNYGSEYTGLLRATLKAEVYNLSDHADQLNLNLLATINPSNSLYAGLAYRFKLAPYFPSNPNGFANALFLHGVNINIGHQQSEFTVGGDFKNLNVTGKASTTTLGIDKDFILRNSHRINSSLSINKKSAETSQADNISYQDKLSILTWTTIGRWNDNFGYPAANLIKFDYHQGLPGFNGAMKGDKQGTSRYSKVDLNGDGEIEDDEKLYASSDFTRSNLLISRNQGVGEYQLLLKLQLQFTDEILLPSEQSNLGGPFAVRGYASSDFSADKSVNFTIEFSGHSNARKFSIPISNLKLAAFIDHGVGRRITPLENEDPFSFSQMTSIGGYAQFIKGKNFTSKIELAMPLRDVNTSKKQGLKVLFNLNRGF